MAQLIARVFADDFPMEWPGFFDDLIGMISKPGVLDVYFRILIAIHELVADREVQHLNTPEEQARFADTKDSMRVSAIGAIANTWYQCLTAQEIVEKSPSVCLACLRSIALYVSWIDINLVVNDRLIPVLFQFVKERGPLQAESCKCLRAILQKGMDPSSKATMISNLGLIGLAGLLFQNMQDDDDDEYSEALAQFCCTVGVELIGCVKDVKAAGNDHTETTALMESCIPLQSTVLGSEYDEISEQVMPFVRDYLLFAKTEDLSPTRRENIAVLQQTIMRKLRYDDDFDHSNKSSDDAIDFQEYRRQLEILFENINLLDSALYLDVGATFASNVLSNIGTNELHVNDVEVALHIVFLMGGTKQHATSERMTTLMELATSGSVGMYNHPAVSLKFFEVCVRLGGKFFYTHPDRLVHVLQAFIGETGINNADGHVRSRASYWFLRMVKLHGRVLLHPYIPSIVNALQPICMSEAGQFSNEDQLFLIEALGLLVTSSAVNPPDQGRHIEGLVRPCLERFTSIGVSLPQATSQDEQEQRILSMKHIVLMVTAVSKGFIKLAHLEASQCKKVFEQALIVFMQSLSIPCNMECVRTGVRTYLHRLIVCMGEGILPVIPAALSTMLDVHTCQINDLKEFVPLINQIIDKFKQKVEPMLNDIFLPLIEATFANLNQAVDPSDLDTLNELKLLRRCYYEFLNCVISNSLTEILISETNAPHTQQVLATIVDGAGQTGDPKAQKVCFHMLHKLARVWFGKPNAGMSALQR